MPLAEITNLQQPPARSKRFSLGNGITPKGENVAPTSLHSSAKETPARLNRFFAPTKASAAKTTPHRAQPHSGRNTPNSQTQTDSRLPRRSGAPIITPPTSKWSAFSASRAGLSSKLVQSSKSSPLLRELSDSEDYPSPVSRFDELVSYASANLAMLVAFPEHAVHWSPRASD